ncbi:hypothetical protein ACLQ2R_19660 [Streptosporangium sp. DT93]|uniref:hypothetical protein n=1 Tax=Streptosporangium sp. DT93 TaxID=3393428 RepID=UPI003CEC3029
MAGRASTKELAVVDESSMAKVAAREVSKAIVLGGPWLVGLLTLGVGSAFHFILDSDDPDVVAWTVFLLAAAVLVLTAVTYGQSHARGTWGRVHTTLTMLLCGLWVTAATINGPMTVVTGRLMLIGGFTLALTWNIRSVIRLKGIDVAAVAADPLSALFGQGAERAGMAIEAKTTAATAHKVEGAVQLEQGKQTAEDLQRKVPYIESGIGLPPGSITASIDPDDASKAKITVSDPRVMKRPIPWPGPSRPGESIAKPLRPGLWQDLDEVAHIIVGHHVQVMGQTGSGKSIGGAWNYIAEIVTRHDAAVFAIDVTKGEQTLGPLAESLHRFETSKAGAKALIREMQAKVKERTDQLAAMGLQKWKEGCGLTYWVLWLEECPDILDLLSDKEMDDFLSLLKAIRSAGGTVVLSLQRSDYTQMPTLARGQLAKMCFGVENSADASFGLSDAQQDANARPELWSNKQPGMAYLDAPSIPDERIAMPNRTYAWGCVGEQIDDERANAEMRAHAAAWPAAAKKVDAGTAALSRLPGGGQALEGDVEQPAAAVDGQDGEDDDEEVRNVAAEYQTIDDPDPTVQAGLDDPIRDDPDDPEWEFTPPAVSMTAAERGAALLAHLHGLWDEGARDFATRDLRPLWESTDMSRAWAQKQLKRLVEAGVLGYDEGEQRYVMAERPNIG